MLIDIAFIFVKIIDIREASNREGISHSESAREELL